MRKNIFLLVLCSLAFGFTASSAQIVNGSFTTDLSGWTQLGSPTQGSSNPPGGTYANISSTNDDAIAGAPASNIAAALHVILPFTDVIYAPTDGQAIYQYFLLAHPETLSFKYAYSTFDIYPQDSAGMTLDGQYTQFQQTPATQQITPSSYMTVANVQLSAGEHQLGFVSYNTGDTSASTHIYITDIELADVPEPGIWRLVAVGLAGLFALAFAQRPTLLRA